MIVSAVNVSVVTNGIVEMLKQWPALANATISRSEEINETAGGCPWIGVYRDNVDYVIKTVGYGSGMRDQRMNLVVLVQEADGVSGEKCEDRLEALLREVISAILSDVTLGGTARVVDELTVRYSDYRKEGGSFMQTAAIYLTAVTVVTVS